MSDGERSRAKSCGGLGREHCFNAFNASGPVSAVDCKPLGLVAVVAHAARAEAKIIEIAMRFIGHRCCLVW